MSDDVPLIAADSSTCTGMTPGDHGWANGLQLWLTGPLLVLLGGTVLIGWIGHWPLLVGLLPGFPPMVINTALMFVASGLALLALARTQRRALRLLGVGVGILALAVLAEHGLDLDLGIDLATAHAWAQDGFPHPGRPARATALCFALTALALILLGNRARPWLARTVATLAVLILLISLSSGFGHLLGLDSLYPSYVLRGMSIPTAAGMLLLGSCLLWTTLREKLRDQVRGDDTRIIAIGSLLLVGSAMATGLPILHVVRSQVEATMVTGLRTALGMEVQLIDAILRLRMERAAIITNRPNAISTLGRNPDDTAARELVQATMDSFRPHGFSALRVTLPGGKVVAASGRFVVDPELSVPLSTDNRHALLWRDAYYLRSRFEIRDADQDLLLATVETEQPMPQIAAAIEGARSLGQTGELQLCQRREARIDCFSDTLSRQPFSVPITSPHDSRLLLRAAIGGTGIHRGRDYSGRQVIGIYAPVMQHGLFAVLKIDSAALYGPLRRSLEIVLALGALAVVGGSLLFRAVVKPIAAELIRAREISAGKSRAMERLHAFQRAVFEQAPDGILVSDGEGLIIEANERIAALFGHARERLQGMRIEELVPQRVRAEHHHHRAAFQQAPSTRGMSHDRSLQGQRADGSEFPIEVALAPMNTPEGQRVIAIVKDVSEARRAEQLIRDSLKEKELLLGEIHHRVKNNLQIVQSLLDMQAGLTGDAAAASALRDSQNRVQSMALIHQTLYQSHNFAEVEFGHFLNSLTSHLQSSYGRRDLLLSSHAERVSLPIDRAIPCGLIVNELVTNALKHGFPDGRSGSIKIELKRLDEQHVEVAVSDDGIGIPDSLDLDTLSSLGMQLVGVLAEQLHARLRIQRRGPTRVAFSFTL